MLVQIEINSGYFVVAKRMHEHTEGVDIGGGRKMGGIPETDSYVRINGGSVYAGNGQITPPPTKPDGTTAVYPLHRHRAG
jgi:hypothetical protein